MKNRPYYGSLSPCHNIPRLIVLSREGGFVTQNCLECGEPKTLPFEDLPVIICNHCDIKMNAFINSDKNYAYKCSRCEQEFELATVVPHWQNRFNYHGFGLESDYLDYYGQR